MINLLLGAPGGGKSYEAVVYHVLPALKAGRKVITNLPLDLKVFAAVSDDYLELIEIRTATLPEVISTENEHQEEQAINDPVTLLTQAAALLNSRTQKRTANNYPFSNPQDYADKWRHPETGSGPLYIIDECHIALPYSGTPLEVEHWYSLHRHESADVLLITQSYSKINKAIRDLVQVVYQVRKNTALGSQGSYTRKVRDGLKGEVVNTDQRTYKKQFFKYYQSHTRGGGSELAANDIVPIWKHWSFKSALFMFAIFGYMVASGNFKMPFAVDAKPLKPKVVKSKAVNVEGKGVLPESSQLQTSNSLTQHQLDDSDINPSHKHPFDGLGLHILGSISSEVKGYHYLLGLSQNGQKVRMFSQNELIAAGYSFTSISQCSARIEYEEVYADFIRCDFPQSSPMSARRTRS